LLVSEVGTASAQAALSEYSAVLGSIAGDSDATSPAAATPSGSTGTQSDASSSIVVITLLGSAVCLSAASFLLAM
jgi:hypothetical protein